MSDRDNDLIGPLAAFIGARLHYPNPEVNGQGNPWVSTIRVDQHKEKFWYVRVYCRLADPDLVKQKWEWLKANKATFQGKACYLPKFDVTDAEDPPSEFKQLCLKHDAIHYREVYREAVALQPHLQSKICGQANHVELLFPQHSELCEHIDGVVEPHREYLYKKYGVPDADALKAYLKVVYEPSYKDRWG